MLLPKTEFKHFDATIPETTCWRKLKYLSGFINHPQLTLGDEIRFRRNQSQLNDTARPFSQPALIS